MSKEKLRLAFAGTPKLAATILETLIMSSAHDVRVVYTQPDRPSGRGRKLTMSAVKQSTIKHELPVLQPETPAELNQDNRLSDVDALIVVAYGMLLPEELLSRPTYGCINMHTSLLPRWRGAAPIQRAIQAGDKETGITIMQIDAGLDTGPILAQVKCPIDPVDTAGTLHDKLAKLGGICLLETLENIMAGGLAPIPQDHTHASYAKKITKAEAQLDWSLSALELERKVRAFNPAPVCYTELHDLKLRIWQAEAIDQVVSKAPGSILDCTKTGIDIATKVGVLRLLKIQAPGKRVQTAAEFLNGRPDFAGLTRES